MHNIIMAAGSMPGEISAKTKVKTAPYGVRRRFLHNQFTGHKQRSALVHIKPFCSESTL